MEQIKKEEKQTTPDLERIMTEGRPVFSGTAEPAAETPGPAIIGHPGQEAPASDGKPAVAPAETPVAPETPGDPAKPPATPSPAVAPQEPDGKGKESPRGDYRFKTLEDADKSYRLLQSEKTKTEKKLKALETELEGKKSEETRQAAAEEEDKTFLEFATERNTKALTEINDLNPDDPEYTAKASACWARANLEIRRWKPTAPDPSLATGPDGEHKPSGSGERPNEKPSDDAPAPDAVIMTRSFVESVLEGAELGIAKDDPLFWSFAEQSPAVHEDGTPIPMKDQIWYAVERTLKYRQGIAKPAAPEVPVNPSASEETGSPPAPPAGPTAAQPMGRSGAFRPAGGDPVLTGPVSLADTLDSVREMRRL